MQSSRDSSVWRTLAVAFGDGLAFGAGITLTRSAARLAAPKSMTPDLRSLNARLTEIEQRGIELTGHARAGGTRPAAGAAHPKHLWHQTSAHPPPGLPKSSSAALNSRGTRAP